MDVKGLQDKRDTLGMSLADHVEIDIILSNEISNVCSTPAWRSRGQDMHSTSLTKHKAMPVPSPRANE